MGKARVAPALDTVLGRAPHKTPRYAPPPVTAPCACVDWSGRLRAPHGLRCPFCTSYLPPANLSWGATPTLHLLAPAALRAPEPRLTTAAGHSGQPRRRLECTHARFFFLGPLLPAPFACNNNPAPFASARPLPLRGLVPARKRANPAWGSRDDPRLGPPPTHVTVRLRGCCCCPRHVGVGRRPGAIQAPAPRVLLACARLPKPAAGVAGPGLPPRGASNGAPAHRMAASKCPSGACIFWNITRAQRTRTNWGNCRYEQRHVQGRLQLPPAGRRRPARMSQARPSTDPASLVLRKPSETQSLFCGMLLCAAAPPAG